uniref:Transmembrane protein n=1 Tax=Steinernema glaseri TaxID=37863 RepID=A0A1I8AS00_9BILA
MVPLVLLAKEGAFGPGRCSFFFFQPSKVRSLVQSMDSKGPRCLWNSPQRSWTVGAAMYRNSRNCEKVSPSTIVSQGLDKESRNLERRAVKFHPPSGSEAARYVIPLMVITLFLKSFLTVHQAVRMYSNTFQMTQE